MTTKNKTFDCVDMKNAAQKQLLEEYEANKLQYRSFVDFINRKAESDEIVKEMRKRIAKKKG